MSRILLFPKMIYILPQQDLCKDDVCIYFGKYLKTIKQNVCLLEKNISFAFFHCNQGGNNINHCNLTESFLFKSWLLLRRNGCINAFLRKVSMLSHPCAERCVILKNAWFLKLFEIHPETASLFPQISNLFQKHFHRHSFFLVFESQQRTGLKLFVYSLLSISDQQYFLTTLSLVF